MCDSSNARKASRRAFCTLTRPSARPERSSLRKELMIATLATERSPA
jgi:hypothetical protein